MTMTNLNNNSIKIVVTGSKKAGKSALTVRYLTKRFIGEYRSNIDLLYKQTITVDNVTSEVEILDISRRTVEIDDDFLSDHVRWCDAFVVVYSISDCDSFQTARSILAEIEKLRGGGGGGLRSGSTGNGDVPVVLLGNKRDLEHARTVGVESGRSLALRYGCQFYEVSAADGHFGVTVAFENLVRETRSERQQKCHVVPTTRQRKLSMFAVSKMIGAIIGHGKNNAAKTAASAAANVNNNNNHHNNNNNNNNNNSNRNKKSRPSLSL